MREIPLTQGQVALIDDCDFERVSQYKWTASYHKRNNKFVASARINGKRILMHRFIMNVNETKVQVDHQFHNTLDNRRDKLRVCTNAQNQVNQKKHKGTSSRFKGVCWVTRLSCWFAQIIWQDKHHSLGYFETEEAAAYYWNKAAIEYHGEFAQLNELTEEELRIALSHPAKKAKTSKFKGVSWNKRYQKWVVSVWVKNKKYFIGYFDSETKAAEEFNKKAIELLGEKAIVNTL